jgi:hypothetical protein
MADQSLKGRYRGVAAERAEMAHYRSRLAERLASQTPAAGWPPLLYAAAPVAIVVTLLAILLAVPAGGPVLPQTRLAEVQALAGEASPELMARARRLLERGQPLDRDNARMLLCLREGGEEALRLAGEGLATDPRPEFRFFYLELLLDRADEHWFNRVRIERLMDREEDRGCLRLYKDLLRLAI